MAGVETRQYNKFPCERRYPALQGGERHWLLVYKINPDATTVTFHRTGTHSGLLKNNSFLPAYWQTAAGMWERAGLCAVRIANSIFAC
jgi:hypothetical protein